MDKDLSDAFFLYTINKHIQKVNNSDIQLQNKYSSEIS